MKFPRSSHCRDRRSAAYGTVHQAPRMLHQSHDPHDPVGQSHISSDIDELVLPNATPPTIHSHRYMLYIHLWRAVLVLTISTARPSQCGCYHQCAQMSPTTQVWNSWPSGNNMEYASRSNFLKNLEKLNYSLHAKETSTKR
jgi:hypothetical protein